MNKKFTIIIGLFTIFTLTVPAGAQNTYIDIVHSFSLAPGYEMKSVAEAPLIWPSDSNQTIRVNITLSKVPDDISGIVIDLLTFSIFITDKPEDVGTQTDYQYQVPQEEINVVDKELSYNQSILTPVRGNSFYINVTIFAKTTGNRTQGESSTYSYRFPVDDTIIVSRVNDRVPLINLYGFPPRSFFLKWIPIYLTILVISLSPAYISVYYRIKELMSKKEVSKSE